MNYKTIISYTAAFMLVCTLAYPVLTNSFAFHADFQTVGMDDYVPPENPPAADPNDPPEYPEGEADNGQDLGDPYDYDPDNPYKDWE